MSKTKLELTWIGKNERKKLEPRILLEDPSKSYHASQKVTDNDIFDNKLIFGDNLLALKALEQEYAGQVKCIFIDPPYNTGSAFEHYDDGIEHSVWLSLMSERLRLLQRLLRQDGIIFIQIDDREHAYLKVLCDEIFERRNFITSVTVQMSHLSGVKMSHVEKNIPKIKEHILVYSNSPDFKFNKVFVKADWDSTFSRYRSFLSCEPSEPIETWTVEPLGAVIKSKNLSGDSLEKFLLKNAHRIFRTARNRSEVFMTLPKDEQFRAIKTSSGLDKYAYKGEEVLFCSEKLVDIDGENVPAKPLGDIWLDIGINNLHNEGSVDFRNGKKPEKLVKRCIDLSTNPGDLVLDSFGGSGTTGAVAHKMGRRWIMVELGEHCHTHIIPRLQKVIDGEEQGGISKAVNWQGGGGFRYYKLAPSLIVKDKFGLEVINKEYNPEMLAEAVCKLEGFTYAPSVVDWWDHGYSTETDHIYVTTQSLSVEKLEALSEEVGSDRTLLVMCGAFRCEVSRFANLTLKKLPKAILDKCQFGQDDYSLNVANLTDDASDESDAQQDD
ncbi:site-specific DNA-methyltransferase [Oceanisphaera avium]|uniref:site-specific DNA-methyltransferase (adenine-specific) n=1 Tax=Oceanisphaera avium TaxID=1903694 RepID=A0A1Y0CVK0_9GAMM|nr:site-specific DNA-methyltransferase [Oceanisphaera avium]ART78927.1 site-specific DNA-methyltransferase [Oceanisphaera avium]